MKKVYLITWVSLSLGVICVISLVLFWPENWNLNIFSVLINIFSGLLILSIEILVVIFIIEKLIEREKQRNKNERLKLIHAYIAGQLSILIDSVIHKLVFISYGRNIWIKYFYFEAKQTNVPISFTPFYSWLIENYLDNNRLNKEKINRYKLALDNHPTTPILIDIDQFSLFVHKMQKSLSYFKDSVTFIQPMVLDNFGILFKLISYVRILENFTNDIYIQLSFEKTRNSSTITIEVDEYHDFKNLIIKSIELFEFIIDYLSLDFLKKDKNTTLS